MIHVASALTQATSNAAILNGKSLDPAVCEADSDSESCTTPGDIALPALDGASAQDALQGYGVNTTVSTFALLQSSEVNASDNFRSLYGRNLSARHTVQSVGFPADVTVFFGNEQAQKGRQLGSGTFGTSYEWSVPGGETFAVKCVRARNTDKNSIDMVKQEIGLMQKLHAEHHNTPLLPWGEGEGKVRFENTRSQTDDPSRKYQVETNLDIWLLPMPKYDGDTLDKYIKRGKITEEQALDVVRQIGTALRELHSQGTIHFDVKSENIMLVRENDFTDVRLIDYGLAGPRTKVLLEAKGSPLYMSLERFQRRYIPSRRDDFYAVGLSLLEMLTGCTAEQLFGNPETVPDLLSKLRTNHLSTWKKKAKLNTLRRCWIKEVGFPLETVVKEATITLAYDLIQRKCVAIDSTDATAVPSCLES